MVLLKRILILEDNLIVLSKILEGLAVLEQNEPYDLSITLLTDHEQVAQLLNNKHNVKFDIILLDRDCKLNGSFHVLDIERFGVDKVIAMSSVPRYNEELKKRGVKTIVEKDTLHLDEFLDKLMKEIQKRISIIS